MKKNSTPCWELARKAPSFQSAPPPPSLSSRQACDVINGAVWPCPHGQSSGVARHQQPHLGAPRLQVGGSVLLCVEEGGGRAERSKFQAPISLTSTAPCRNVQDAGAPQPGGGDATGDTETSGKPGKGPFSPPFIPRLPSLCHHWHADLTLAGVPLNLLNPLGLV